MARLTAWPFLVLSLLVLSLAAVSVTPTAHAQSSLVELSATELDFERAGVEDTTRPQSVEMTNLADLPVSISTLEVTTSSDDFTADVDACIDATLDAGAACPIRFRFSPASPGPSSATATISATVLGLPLAARKVELRGTGVPPGTISVTVPERAADPEPDAAPAPEATEPAPEATPEDEPDPVGSTEPGGPGAEPDTTDSRAALTTRADRPTLPPPDSGAAAASTIGDQPRAEAAAAASGMGSARTTLAEGILLGLFVVTSLVYVLALAWAWRQRQLTSSGHDATSTG